MPIKFKNDQFKRTRGGYSRLLDISCAKCGARLCFYQKDGPGILKRIYLDRIFKGDKYSGLENSQLKAIPNLVCLSCSELLGTPYVYPKENRLAFRLFVGAIIKRIVKST